MWFLLWCHLSRLLTVLAPLTLQANSYETFPSFRRSQILLLPTILLNYIPVVLSLPSEILDMYFLSESAISLHRQSVTSPSIAFLCSCSGAELIET